LLKEQFIELGRLLLIPKRGKSGGREERKEGFKIGGLFWD